MPIHNIAVIVNEYLRGDHADAIVGKMIEGYQHEKDPDHFNDGKDNSNADNHFKVFTLIVYKGENDRDISKDFRYIDTKPANQNGRQIDVIFCNESSAALKSAVDAALYNSNAARVDGVVVIGGYGTVDDGNGAQVDPRKLFLDVIFTIQNTPANRPKIPVFTSKHLAASWSDAKAIYDNYSSGNQAVPLMAGSVWPFGWRQPDFTFNQPFNPNTPKIRQALLVGFGKPETWLFHAFEVLQATVERRAGGEVGIVVAGGNVTNGFTFRYLTGRTLLDEWVDTMEPDATLKREVARALLVTPNNVSDAVSKIANHEQGGLAKIQYGNYPDGTPGAKAYLLMANGCSTERPHPGSGNRMIEWPFAYDEGVGAGFQRKAFQLQANAPTNHFQHQLKGFKENLATPANFPPLKRTLFTNAMWSYVMNRTSESQEFHTFLNLGNGTHFQYLPNTNENSHATGPMPSPGRKIIKIHHGV